jgi:hypothetical protein
VRSAPDGPGPGTVIVTFDNFEGLRDL